MLSKRFTKLFYWLAQFIYMQSFLSLILLPILISWGLPFSLYCVVGNFLFGPLITVFLILSSLLFVCQLLALPSTIFVWLLELITSCWYRLLSYAQRNWLIGLPAVSWPLLMAIPATTLWLAIFLIDRHPWHKAIAMSGLFIGICLIIHGRCIPTTLSSFVPCCNGSVYLLYHKGTVFIVDPGVIGQRQSAASWAQYTLAPCILRATGKTSIDHLLLLQPNRTSLKAIKALAEKLTIKNIYIPLQSDRQNLEILASISTNVISLEKDCTQIGTDDNQVVKIIQKRKKSNKDRVKRPSYVFESTIDNAPVTIYPSGYTKRNKDAQPFTTLP